MSLGVRILVPQSDWSREMWRMLKAVIEADDKKKEKSAYLAFLDIIKAVIVFERQIMEQDETARVEEKLVEMCEELYMEIP